MLNARGCPDRLVFALSREDQHSCSRGHHCGCELEVVGDSQGGGAPDTVTHLGRGGRGNWWSTGRDVDRWTRDFDREPGPTDRSGDGELPMRVEVEGQTDLPSYAIDQVTVSQNRNAMPARDVYGAPVQTDLEANCVGHGKDIIVLSEESSDSKLGEESEPFDPQTGEDPGDGFDATTADSTVVGGVQEESLDTDGPVEDEVRDFIADQALLNLTAVGAGTSRLNGLTRETRDLLGQGRAVRTDEICPNKFSLGRGREG